MNPNVIAKIEEILAEYGSEATSMSINVYREVDAVMYSQTIQLPGDVITLNHRRSKTSQMPLEAVEAAVRSGGTPKTPPVETQSTTTATPSTPA